MSKKKNEIWKNLKSDRNYEVLSKNINNATNAQEGQIMVLYSRKEDYVKNPATFLFIREINEFYEKFIKVE